MSSIAENPLSQFVGTERERYADEDNNRFAFSLSQASRYYRFLLIIAERHNAASRELIEITKQVNDFTRNSTGSRLTDEQQEILTKSLLLSTKVQLEIESFYLFAKIFLDKIAHFFHDYFGQANGISLRSHDQLTKNHERLRAAKTLVYPEGFSEMLEFLARQICDYRDKQIQHLQNPRATKGIAWGEKGLTRIAGGYLYPNVRDQPLQSGTLTEMIAKIDVYTEQVMALITTNREKTRFKLKAQSANQN